MSVPLTPKSTRDLLTQLGHEPKRFLGQNFLVDGNIVRKSLELGGVTAGDTVVEIGPGLGTLTNALLDAGAEVWAIERDYGLHKHLAATLAAANPRLHLMEGDGVEHPLAGFDPLGAGCPHPAAGDTSKPRGEGTPPPSRPFKIVANLPYAIATPWLDGVLSGPLPDRMVLMLQQEAAQRYVAQPGSKTFGAISITLQAAYAVAPGHKVDGSCFYPQPDIESYLLHLTRLPDPFVFPAAVKAVIRACFQQRRKQIGGLLRNKLPDGGAAWLAELSAAGFGPHTRPEQIPVALWRRLTV